jgi:hypothetical protein
MLSDLEVETIVTALEKEAIGYSGEGSDIQNNRALLLDRYNRQPYGDEIEGQSQIVTSDVFDVVESMLPGLIRLFTQNRNIAKFVANKEESEQEAEQKTQFANWVFNTQHDPVHLLLSYCKDALLQYTGTLKTYWDDSEEFLDGEDYEQLTQAQLNKLLSDPNYDISDVQEIQIEIETQLPNGQIVDAGTVVYDVQGIRTNSTGRIKIEPTPPNEMLISKRAKDFKKPPFYGQITPKTRSELLQMGFDREMVMNLGRDESDGDPVEERRNYNLNGPINKNSTTDKSQDMFKLGEYYAYIDRDEDGIAEYYQIFFVSGESKLLEMSKIDNHPLATATAIPMPHRAIGECPASLVADHQYWTSTLVRQANNNIYAGNFTRLLYNNKVDSDELMTPVAGGVVSVDTSGPVSGSIEPIPTVSQIEGILRAIEYADTVKERRTGVTSYNQGMDTEALNKTATGFVGIRDMAQMRTELIARVLSEGLKKVFNRIIELASKYQRRSIQIMVSGAPFIIDPTQWKYKTDCVIDIGVGGGERQERIQNLNYIYEQQKLLRESGSALTDEAKMYNTLDKITQQVGLHGAESYFNNPEQPDELLMAEVERLTRENQQLMQIAEQKNQLAEAEAVKGQVQIALKEIDAQSKAQQEQLKAMGKMAELEQKDRHHDDDLAVELTKIEADSNKDVPGSLI